MALQLLGQPFSGAAKVWENFVAEFPELAGGDPVAADAVVTDEFRDEYVRLPYDDVPPSQECRW